MQSAKPIRKNNLIWRNVDGEVVIISDDNKTMNVLNGVASRIWDLLDGKHDLNNIISIISSEYKTDREIVVKDINEFIRDLDVQGFLGQKNG